MGQLQSGCFFIEPLVGSFFGKNGYFRLIAWNSVLRHYMILHTFFAKVISEDENFEQRVGTTNYILS